MVHGNLPALGKSPLHCRLEPPGHIANRLQDVLSCKFSDSYCSYFQDPGLSEKTRLFIVENTLSQISGRNLDTLERMRDEFLIDVIKLRDKIKTMYGVDKDELIGR